MHISKVSFDKIQALSFKDVFYQQNYYQLKEFISFEPTLNGLEEAMAARKAFPVDRVLLVKVLADHYAGYQTSEKQYQNIYKLKETETFTVTTAHQPGLAGGPAYYFYKIFSIITAQEASPKIFVDVLIISIILSIPKTNGKATTGIPAVARTATTRSDGPGTPAVCRRSHAH